MRESNKQVTLPGEELLEVLAEIEFILISLHKMGAYYVDKPVADYQRATTDFIDGENVTGKLAKVRHILSARMDSTLGDDDMDDMERYIKDMKVWTPES